MSRSQELLCTWHTEAHAPGAWLYCWGRGVEATDSGSLMSGRNWVKGRAGREPCRGGGKAGEEAAHVWFLFCDREQGRNWRLGELFGLSSICNKSSSISSPQTAQASEIALLDANERTHIPHSQGLASAPLSPGSQGGHAAWGVGLWAEVLSPVAHAGYPSFLLNLPKPGASPSTPLLSLRH